MSDPGELHAQPAPSGILLRGRRILGQSATIASGVDGALASETDPGELHGATAPSGILRRSPDAPLIR